MINMRILLTGMSGVGKTTTLAELQKRGYLVIDLDATGICTWRNIKTRKRVQYGWKGRDRTWLAKHVWHCDIKTLKRFLSCIRKDKTVFVAGMADNFRPFSKVFDKAFVLYADDAVIKRRLARRTNNHFAKREDEMLYMFEYVKELMGQLKNPIHVDTSKKPAVVAQTILKKSGSLYSA